MIKRTKARIKQTGEVFTPAELVNELADWIPSTVWENPTSNVLDPACGDGNIIVVALRRKIDCGVDPTSALRCVYGVDLMPDNVDECRRRLLQVAGDTNEHRAIVEHNIVNSSMFDWDFENWCSKDTAPPLTSIDDPEPVVEVVKTALVGIPDDDDDDVAIVMFD